MDMEDNAGPGCSSLGYGAFMEHGPFKPAGPNGELLRTNKYSWNMGNSSIQYMFFLVLISIMAFQIHLFNSADIKKLYHYQKSDVQAIFLLKNEL